jgi:hypothetical protein
MDGMSNEIYISTSAGSLNDKEGEIKLRQQEFDCRSTIQKISDDN